MIRSILGHACVAYRPAAPVSLPATPWGISQSDRFRLDLPVIDLDAAEWMAITPPACVVAQMGGGK